MQIDANQLRPTVQQFAASPRRFDLLGEGGFGMVYKARFRNEPVAVKVLRPNENARDPKKDLKRRVAEMKREFECIKALDRCPSGGVLMVLGIVNTGDLAAMVMEFAPNGSLGDLLRSTSARHVSVDRKKAWIAQIISGMAWIHSATPPVVHRDLKADNILLNKHMEAMIADFGLARPSEEGNVGGTVRFLAPECFLRREQGLPSDVYAFAMVLVEMANHRFPWSETKHDNVPALVARGAKPKVEPTGLDDASLKLMQRCWATDPSDRPTFFDLRVKLAKQDSFNRRSGNRDSPVYQDAPPAPTRPARAAPARPQSQPQPQQQREPVQARPARPPPRKNENLGLENLLGLSALLMKLDIKLHDAADYAVRLGREGYTPRTFMEKIKSDDLLRLEFERRHVKRIMSRVKSWRES